MVMSPRNVRNGPEAIAWILPSLNVPANNDYSLERTLAKICSIGNAAEIQKFLNSSKQTLLEAIDIKSNPYGRSYLLHPCRNLNEEVIVYFLDNGIDFNISTDDGCSPLMAIVVASSPQNQTTSVNCAQRLINAGVKVAHSPKFKGRTLLTMAVSRGSTGLINLLIQAGAALDERDDNGETPFNVAIDRNMQPMVELLFMSGANPFVNNLSGARCTDIAARGECVEMQQCVLTILCNYYEEKFQGKGPLFDEMQERVNGNCASFLRSIIPFTDSERSLTPLDQAKTGTFLYQMDYDDDITNDDMVPTESSEEVMTNGISHYVVGGLALSAVVVILTFVIKNNL